MCYSGQGVLRISGESLVNALFGCRQVIVVKGLTVTAAEPEVLSYDQVRLYLCPSRFLRDKLAGRKIVEWRSSDHVRYAVPGHIADPGHRMAECVTGSAVPSGQSVYNGAVRRRENHDASGTAPARRVDSGSSSQNLRFPVAVEIL